VDGLDRGVRRRKRLHLDTVERENILPPLHTAEPEPVGRPRHVSCSGATGTIQLMHLGADIPTGGDDFARRLPLPRRPLTLQSYEFP